MCIRIRVLLCLLKPYLVMSLITRTPNHISVNNQDLDFTNGD